MKFVLKYWALQIGFRIALLKFQFSNDSFISYVLENLALAIHIFAIWDLDSHPNSLETNILYLCNKLRLTIHGSPKIFGTYPM